VLAYAAVLRGLSVEALETGVLAAHLSKRGYASVADAVKSSDQLGGFDESEFRSGLETALASGAFRLVLVLDEAPQELVRLVGYLEAMAPGLVIDLVTVSAYRVGETTVMVPQRVEPEREGVGLVQHAPKPATFYAADGGAEFRKVADAQPEAKRAVLGQLIDWATALEHDGLTKLYSYLGQTHSTLLPRLPGEESGPFTIWESGLVTAFRSVLERRSPQTLAELDARLPKPVGKGTVVQPVDAEMLALMRRAFEEAAGK
jgi:hypothetical protein